MKMNKSMSKSTSANLIDLYTRIPDYSEVQHLGQSDFINTLERLKEEFRQCRASLYNEEFCSDSEYLAEKSSPANGRSKNSDNLYYYSTSSKFANNTTENKPSLEGLGFSFDDGHGKAKKINNHDLTTTTSAVFNGNAARERSNEDRDAAGSSRTGQYLSIRSCELHRTPYRTTSATSLAQPNRYLGPYETRSFLLGDREGDYMNDDEKSYLDDDDYQDDEDDDFEGYENVRRTLGRNNRSWSVASSNSDISISKWSSNPEIYRAKSKEFVPPSNIEQRILQRKSQNNSAPSVAFKDEPEEEIAKPKFKANPVPDHVYKPLYEFIMLKNQRRSERIREQSKRRLLSQVKPFSFCKDANNSKQTMRPNINRSSESLNNTKPLKKKRNDMIGNIKTNNNRLNSTTALFRAKPAPPRTKALLAAIRQKEQQDYRELKKRLRAETLLKNASLPPSMAAREKRTKITNAKIDEVLQDYQKSFAENKRKGRNYRETSTGTDDTALLTDEDRMTEDDFGSGMTSTTKKITTVVKPFKFSQRSPRKFTSFGTSRHSAAASGVFEASSNDNHASRLRYQAAKMKEQARIKREEEEMLKIMRAERRRQKLRNCHLHAWQHACSYSAEQDIAMRRQLRHAASILERESFIRDMSCMLSRVRSAPLLLEGGNRLERKQEPCKQHRDEFRKLFSNTSSQGGGGSGSDRPWNKLSTPRLYTWSGGSKQNTGSNRALSMLDRYGGGDDKSETVALAEGSLSDSDNESSGHVDHSDDEGNNRHHRHQIADSFAATDSGSSELEEEDGGNESGHAKTNNTHVSQTVGETNGNNARGELMTGNGSNQDNGDGKIEERDSHALATDNEIDDEVEDGSDEEQKEVHTETHANPDNGHGIENTSDR